MTVPIVMIHVLQMLYKELCHDRDTYHYLVNKDACSEFNDFLKALCTL